MPVRELERVLGAREPTRDTGTDCNAWSVRKCVHKHVHMRACKHMLRTFEARDFCSLRSGVGSPARSAARVSSMRELTSLGSSLTCARSCARSCARACRVNSACARARICARVCRMHGYCRAIAGAWRSLLTTTQRLLGRKMEDLGRRLRRPLCPRHPIARRRQGVIDYHHGHCCRRRGCATTAALLFLFPMRSRSSENARAHPRPPWFVGSGWHRGGFAHGRRSRGPGLH